MEFFENANVTASIYHPPKHELGSLGITQGNVVLSVFEFWISLRSRVDGDIFENAPRVDADVLYTDRKRCVFKYIWIGVDLALDSIIYYKEKFNWLCKNWFSSKVLCLNLSIGFGTCQLVKWWILWYTIVRLSSISGSKMESWSHVQKLVDFHLLLYSHFIAFSD